MAVVLILTLSLSAHAASKKYYHCKRSEKWPPAPMKSPDDKSEVLFSVGAGETLHVAVKGFKGRRSFASRSGNYWGAESHKVSWANATGSVSSVCWSPVSPYLFTSVEPIYGEPGIYRLNVDNGKAERVFHPRTKETRIDKGKKYYFYNDYIEITNVSSDGRYLMLYYKPNYEDEKKQSELYAFDTKTGEMIPFKKFTKKHPKVSFADPYDNASSAAISPLEK